MVLDIIIKKKPAKAGFFHGSLQDASIGILCKNQTGVSTAKAE